MSQWSGPIPRTPDTYGWPHDAVAEVERLRNTVELWRERTAFVMSERDRLRKALDYLADGNASAVQAALLRAKLESERA